MLELEALSRMIAPGTKRPGKYRQGVIQIHVTRACDKSCFNCTQGSNLRGPYHSISLEGFESACESLSTYWGVVGMFGGNPALHPEFPTLCEIMSKYIPYEQRGLWCNNPITELNTLCMRRTFNPAVSNLNVHLDSKAYDLFKEHWPESRPFGLDKDSRHGPVHLAMLDLKELQKPCPRCNGEGEYCRTVPILHSIEGMPVTCNGSGYVYDEEKAWDYIADCDINKHWSAMICEFPSTSQSCRECQGTGKHWDGYSYPENDPCHICQGRGKIGNPSPRLRAYFCEIAGAQAILHANDPDWPDTGLDPTADYNAEELKWWQLPMQNFGNQVRFHCHRCAVPLRGYGALAQANERIPDFSKDSAEQYPMEQTSITHAGIYYPKRITRPVSVVTSMVQLGMGRLRRSTDYLGNSRR